MAYHQRLGTAHTEERHRAWHSIIAFGQHKRSDDVGRGMPSPPLDSTLGRMTLGVACHHRSWTAHTVGLRQAWHDITTFGQHTRLNDVGRGMPSSPLGSTNGRTTSGKHAITALGLHERSDYVGRGMTSPPLDRTYGRTISCAACHHRLWEAHTVGNVGGGMSSPPLDNTHSLQCRAWHGITALGQHTRSATAGVA